MRAYPRLIHPVQITIEQVDKPATLYDKDAREPVQQVARKTPVTLPGQVSYGSSSDFSPSATGPQSGEDGYVAFLARELERRDVTLVVGDRIRHIGKNEHDAYVTRVQPRGHYPEYGHTYIRAYFADRQPAKRRAT
jgi:hypothetical protein